MLNSMITHVHQGTLAEVLLFLLFPRLLDGVATRVRGDLSSSCFSSLPVPIP